MKYNPEIHHRRSIRLRGYDYSQAAAYFVTICTQNKEWQFGEIIDGNLDLLPTGKTAHDCLMEIPKHFENVELDAFIVMPNHIHAIFVIHGDKNCRGRTRPAQSGMACHAPTNDKFGKPIPHSLSTIIGSYKSAVTRICNQKGIIFQWQRNYYEHIVRNEAELNKIREYIINNPLNWHDDENYMPNRQKEV